MYLGPGGLQVPSNISKIQSATYNQDLKVYLRLGSVLETLIYLKYETQHVSKTCRVENTFNLLKI